MIFVLFLVSLIGFIGFTWLTITYFQSKYEKHKINKNWIIYLSLSLIAFILGAFFLKIDIITNNLINASSNDSVAESSSSESTKKSTNKVHKAKKRKVINKNTVKIEAVDSSNTTYKNGDFISSKDPDNIINVTFTTDKPANVSYKLSSDGEKNESQMISFQQISSNQYSASIKMLKSSEKDVGSDLYLYASYSGYNSKTHFNLTNYNNSANDNDLPTTNQMKKFKDWLLGEGPDIYDTDNFAGGEDAIEDVSYDESTKTITIEIDDNLNDSFSGIKSDFKYYYSSIYKMADKYYINSNSFTINFEQDNSLVATKNGNNAIKYYSDFYSINSYDD